MKYTKEDYLKLINKTASMERTPNPPPIMFFGREMKRVFDNFLNNKAEELLGDIPKTVNNKEAYED